MFNTLFDQKLDDFIYGTTCTENNFGFDRDSKGTIFNFFKQKVKIPQLAAGVLMAGVITLSGNLSFGTTIILVNSKKGKNQITSLAAHSTKMAERERADLVRKLIRIRDEFALSQDDLAKLLNISSSTISKMERGEHTPDATNYAKYISFLNLSEYLKEKLNGKKYVIRQLFNSKSPVFDDLNPIEFSHTIGEEGLNEVIYTFKRQFG